MNGRILLPVLLALVAGCHSVKIPTNANGTFPAGGSVIPDTKLALTPTYTLSLEKLVYWSGVSAIAYYVVDPMAPNWSIEEAKFPEQRYYLSLKMKRYYTGGAGEARQVFQRRAKEIMRAGGFENFEILEYSEGMDSNAMGSQRVAEGVVAMVGETVPTAR